MDLKQLEYMVAIAECGNISKAAETLFITQSGLNQQLIKLEKELGQQLFYRNKHYLRTTQAGKLYIDSAKEILRIKKNTYAQLEDLKGNVVGEIALGSPMSMELIFLPRFFRILTTDTRELPLIF